MRDDGRLRRAGRRLQQARGILAAVILLTLAGLMGGAAYSYLSYRDAAAQLIAERDRQVALLTAIRLRGELDQLAGELAALAHTSSFRLGLSDRQRQALSGASQRLGIFDGGVIFLDNTGRVRATVPERWDIMSKDWSDKDFFRSMLGRARPAAHFSPLMDIGPDGTPVVVITVPVLGENSELVGTLSGLFKLGESRVSAFYASIVRLRLPGTGNAYIVDSAGRVLYDSGYERTGQVLVPPEVAIVPGDAAPGVSGAVRPAKDAEGHEVVASYAAVPGTGWTLVTETDWAQAMAPVQRFATGLIVLLGLGLVIPTVGVALLARNQAPLGMAWASQEEELFGQQLSNATAGAPLAQALPQRMLRQRALAQRALTQRLFPQHAPMLGGWEVAVYHQAASKNATAHDLYDFMLMPDGRLMLALSTVAARGFAALHLMTTARAAMRAAVCQSASAGQALSLCNNLLCPDLGPEDAIASLLALLDPMSGRVQVANAGLAAPVRWNGRDLVELRESASLLGQALDVDYDHDDLLLGPGESILFYSPGALGARPETGEPFGPERVRRVLDTWVSRDTGGAVGAQAMVDALRADLAEFADSGSLSYLDITFLALSRPAMGTQPPPGVAGAKPRRSLRDELAALGETDTDL